MELNLGVVKLYDRRWEPPIKLWRETQPCVKVLVKTLKVTTYWSVTSPLWLVHRRTE
jgi:hypothetical protein